MLFIFHNYMYAQQHLSLISSSCKIISYFSKYLKWLPNWIGCACLFFLSNNLQHLYLIQIHFKLQFICSFLQSILQLVYVFVRFIQVAYGMTEVMMTCSSHPNDPIRKQQEAAMRPLEGVEVWYTDTDKIQQPQTQHFQ